MSLFSLKQRVDIFLRWSEKYTRTDMIYLSRGSFWLMTGRFASATMSFIFVLVLTNVLPQTVYGTYNFILSIAGILALFSLPGMDIAVTRAVALGNTGAVISGLKKKLQWGLLASIVSLVIAGYYLIHGHTVLLLSFFIIALFSPLQNAFTLYRSYWTGTKDFKRLSSYDAVGNSAHVALVILVLLVTHRIPIIIFVYSASWSLISFILLCKTLKKLKREKKEKKNENTAVMSYGKHLSIMSIFDTVVKYLDKILIWHFLGPLDVAVYSLALMPVAKIQSLLGKIFGDLVFPKFSSKKLLVLKSSLPPKLIKLFFLMLFCVGGYIGAIPYVYKLFFPQYIGSIQFSQALSLMLLVFPIMFLGVTFQAQAAEKELYISNIVRNSIFIGSLIILLPLYGVWGIVAAKLLHQGSSAVSAIILFKKMKA